ncbi:hypothetical protein D1BOALGB6SA_1926 [Olavius sp. associated proteobacterium Delta 1]|nr:hypothetical protein D1BOALGB6SA_1926 [Olavius sp. associated proteobacterium Delta 1]
MHDRQRYLPYPPNKKAKPPLKGNSAIYFKTYCISPILP